MPEAPPEDEGLPGVPAPPPPGVMGLPGAGAEPATRFVPPVDDGGLATLAPPLADGAADAGREWAGAWGAGLEGFTGITVGLAAGAVALGVVGLAAPLAPGVDPGVGARDISPSYLVPP